MPHVLPILRHPPSTSNRIQPITKATPLLPHVPTLMRPRPRRPIQHRVLLPPDTHDRLDDGYGAARIYPPDG